MANTKTLLCYAEGAHGQWEAVCLNFDLAVQGASFEEVRAKMHNAILVYLDTIADYPPEERRRFLKRNAPLSLWLKFLGHAIAAMVCSRFNKHDGQKERAEFTMICPAASRA